MFKINWFKTKPNEVPKAESVEVVIESTPQELFDDALAETQRKFMKREVERLLREFVFTKEQIKQTKEARAILNQWERERPVDRKYGERDNMIAMLLGKFPEAVHYSSHSTTFLDCNLTLNDLVEKIVQTHLTNATSESSD